MLKSKLLLRGIVLAAGLMLGSKMAEALTVVDFEDCPTGQQPFVTSHGLTFVDNLTVSARPETNNPTNSLSVQYRSSFKFVGDGTPFPILSLDIQEGLGNSDSRYVEIWAYTVNRQIIQTLALDGDPTTFETFYPVGLSDVEQVMIRVRNSQGLYTLDGISIDNIVIPEPTVFSLVLIGIMVTHRRKHS